MSTLSVQSIRFYVHRERDGRFLAKSLASWTSDMSRAWHTADRVEAGRIAREKNAKALPVKVSP